MNLYEILLFSNNYFWNDTPLEVTIYENWDIYISYIEDSLFFKRNGNKYVFMWNVLDTL